MHCVVVEFSWGCVVFIVVLWLCCVKSCFCVGLYCVRFVLCLLLC